MFAGVTWSSEGVCFEEVEEMRGCCCRCCGGSGFGGTCECECGCGCDVGDLDDIERRVRVELEDPARVLFTADFGGEEVLCGWGLEEDSTSAG